MVLEVCGGGGPSYARLSQVLRPYSCLQAVGSCSIYPILWAGMGGSDACAALQTVVLLLPMCLVHNLKGLWWKSCSCGSPVLGFDV